jgi:hypothetical protein
MIARFVDVNWMIPKSPWYVTIVSAMTAYSKAIKVKVVNTILTVKLIDNVHIAVQPLDIYPYQKVPNRLKVYIRNIKASLPRKILSKYYVRRF